MTKKLTLFAAQHKVDTVFPGRYQLLTYNGYHSKCDFVWIETGDLDSTFFLRLLEEERFAPSSRQQAFDRRKVTIEERRDIVRIRTFDEAKLVKWDSQTYKVTILWHSGEENTIDWRGLIDNRKSRIYPLSTTKERIKQTVREKYGVDHHAQNREVALKIARNTNTPSIRRHWRTNEELICQGGYESQVVDHLNAHQIDYKWQSQVFTLSDGKTYRPDLYLIDSSIWVEIKGYFRADAKKKWDEFCSLYPNSELWDRKYLRKHKIIKG
jgi:hypothetical protein